NQGKVDLQNFQPCSRFSRRMNIAEHVFKMVEDYSCRLEEQLKTRMEETAVEKRKRPSHSAYAILVSRLPTRSEDFFLLLQNFDRQHWLVVVEALNAGVAITPETYDEVSIYISDIAGFTTTSAMSTPLQFVDLLNDLYTLFYETIANYDIYKVGPCVAGIVGLSMPRYCLFGDAVNRALRMESSGVAFVIHIREKTKTLLDRIGGRHV
ncbi:Retinal guanylyl cyclase 1, partial [Taenia solium]